MATVVDISEHQRTFPDHSDWDGVIIRTVNENGREDDRWRQHKRRADELGIPAGAYHIVKVGSVGADAAARLFVSTLRETSWALVPMIDVELGPATGTLRAYVQRCRDLTREVFGVVGGYYSAGSSYRPLVADLFDRQWIAAWGGRYRDEYDLHQYQGSPLDLNYTPDLARIALAGAVPNTGDDDDMTPEQMVGTLLLALRGNNEIRTEYMSIITGALLFGLRGNADIREELRELVRAELDAADLARVVREAVRAELDR